MKKYGISLIVLIITIIVIVILATAVILSIVQGGVLESAKKSKFMGDFRSVEEGVSMYSISNVDVAKPAEFKLPLDSKLTLSDKQDIKNNVPTLKTKIEELNPGKTIDDIDLYWIDEDAAGVYNLPDNKQDKGYIIDASTKQIYDYVGDFFENKRWHTLDSGVTEVAATVDTQEMWDGWIKLTLFYPSDATDKKWRLGTEGDIRVDPMLMWQEYTGPISIPLDRVQDVWIKYKVGNEEFTIPPAGTLLVDIIPDKTVATVAQINADETQNALGTAKVDKVTININFDPEATVKEYKVGSSDWMEYTAPFTVTENCLIQARAKKVEYVYNADGSFLMSRDIGGKDSVYIGNIGPEDISKVEDSSLPAPTITRLLPVNGDEKARVKVTYPENATKKIFKINYGEEQEYSNEISIAKFGTYVIAYYYDSNGNRSLSTSVYINDISLKPADTPIPYEPLPPYNPETPIPYEPQTTVKLPPPTILRLGASGSEKAKVQITYPANAVRKIYTTNYGSEENYIGQINITAWGTYIMAYYYDADGNKSQIAWIRVNEVPSDPGNFEPSPIEPSEIVPAPTININPNSGLVSQVTASVTVPLGTTDTYIKIGRYGTYKKYTAPVVVDDNTEIYAYYRNTAGEKSLIGRAIVSNIVKKDETGTNNNKPYVYINANPYPWSRTSGVPSVTISIASNYADKVEYSEDGIVYKTYTSPFVVTENKRIYARGTNAYGVTQTYLDITNIKATKPPTTVESLAVNINVEPEPILSTTRLGKVTVSIEYDDKATDKYYSIGKYGTLQTYTAPFDVTTSCTIYGYALSETGKGETSKVIDNLLDGISNPSIVAMPSNSIQASKVTISITYDKYATVKKYSINGGPLTDYTAEFDISENNTMIYAYSENSTGQKSSETYTIQNIIPQPPMLVLDKGDYYLLKLNYPENSRGREYKWKETGEWKVYKEDGILLVKPQKKDSVIKNETLLKVENENGDLVTFEGDYYLIDVPISELFENISMRWDRVVPSAPQIVVDPVDPTKQVTATIVYESAMVKKQYRILKLGENLSDWLDYNGSINIDRNNTVIYAKAMDESEVWSGEAMYKVTNIDELAPVINLIADLSTIKQSVGVEIKVTDDIGISKVKWASGTQGESYFATSGTEVANNSTVNITENGYYTFYAEDQVGNMQVYTLNIENIDVIAPLNPTISAAPTSFTSGNVTVSITYPDDSVLNEYSVNGTTWMTYTAPIIITNNNVTVYVRAKDEAGNQSGQSTLTISNIDKTNPVVVFGTNGETNVETANTTVTVTDTGGSGVNGGTLQYVWDVQNVVAPTAGWTSFTNGSLISKTGVEGLYYLWIKASDNVGNNTVSKSNSFLLKLPIVVNNPVLTTGMTAKKWNGSSWETVDNPSTDTSWYNYTSGQWANAQTADGSMWVWIPRYIYKIKTGWHTSTAGVIDIQFSSGTDDNWNSGSIGAINTGTGSTASANKWTNHPAFTFGSTQLTGIWVAKFEATARQGVSNSIAADNVTTKNVKIIPGVQAWRYSYVSTMYTVCRNMETDSTYGWGTTGIGIDTHMMKNTEWGVVAYLAHSVFGRNGTEVAANTSSSYYTGGGSGTSYITNTSQSTTGNVYGVYDMSGGSAEYTAAYVNNGHSYIASLGGPIATAALQYKDLYTDGASFDSNYSIAANKKGDGIYETSSAASGVSSWFTDLSSMPGSNKPFFLRGGAYNAGVAAGLFNFDLFYGDVSGVYNMGFRPVLLVNGSL